MVNYCNKCGRNLRGCFIRRSGLSICSAMVLRWAQNPSVLACSPWQTLPACLKLVKEPKELAEIIWTFRLMGRLACAFRQSFIPRSPDGTRSLGDEAIPASISDRILEYLVGNLV